MGAREIAKKSRYDQLAYRDRSGSRVEAGVTASHIKAALLAVGTQGHFTVYSARTGSAHLIRWKVGLAYLANLRRGHYAHG